MIRLLLSKRQMARISPYFPLSHGAPRVDDRRVVSGIIYVIRNGLQWKIVQRGYGPRKTLDFLREKVPRNWAEFCDSVTTTSESSIRRIFGFWRERGIIR